MKHEVRKLTEIISPLTAITDLMPRSDDEELIDINKLLLDSLVDFIGAQPISASHLAEIKKVCFSKEDANKIRQ